MIRTGPSPHPAKFSSGIIEVIHDMVGSGMVLDPFAGTGGIHQLREMGNYFTIGVEIEDEWAMHSPYTISGEILSVLDKWPDGIFDAIATSPCYGNRMADTYVDHTRRHTYTSYLGRRPSEGSAAAMQWGEPYRRLHERVWTQCDKKVAKHGVFVINCKDHIRKGQVQKVTDWHIGTLENLGWTVSRKQFLPTASNRHGQNGDKRIDGEWIVKFVRQF